MQCATPINIKVEKTNTYHRVPCGKCGACRQSKRSDWSFRLQQEAKLHIDMAFITLTYSDQNLKLSPYGYPTLDKADFQKFMKRLRKAQKTFTDQKIRYFAVGEYGTKTNRPHYHALLFSAHPELVRELSNIWPFGHVHAGLITPASIHYVTKFHVTKSSDQFETFDDETGEVYNYKSPEFTLMSRRPGIGANYIERNKRFHIDNKANYVRNSGYKQRLPRYYREKLFTSIVVKDQLQLKQNQQALENYSKELNRLKKLDLLDPELYIIKRQIRSAKQVKDKNHDSDLF